MDRKPRLKPKFSRSPVRLGSELLNIAPAAGKGKPAKAGGGTGMFGASRSGILTGNADG